MINGQTSHTKAKTPEIRWKEEIFSLSVSGTKATEQSGEFSEVFQLLRNATNAPSLSQLWFLPGAKSARHDQEVEERSKNGFCLMTPL